MAVVVLSASWGRWCEHAAAAGHAEAQFRLGVMLAKHESFSRRRYEQAAEQGHSGAQSALEAMNH